LTFLSGAAIGAGMALLFAPQSGKETRKQIKDVAGKAVDEVKDTSEKMAQGARNAVKQVKSYIGKEGLREE
jgi:gas vesicle protein